MRKEFFERKQSREATEEEIGELLGGTSRRFSVLVQSSAMQGFSFVKIESRL